MSVRVRFAPSPTGYLHIGGARTAVFNWLIARKHGGKFLLRIEDTDVARSTRESVDAIFDSLKWLGLDWDDEVVFQSGKFDLYRKIAYELLEKGKAYRCYCTPEELEEKRKKALLEGKKPGYDGACRQRKDFPDKPFSIRFIVTDTGSVIVNDIIKGRTIFDSSQIDDFVILRSNGIPTYNFCVVVDDNDSGITHVIRGDDHLNNTPKQILLYEALGYKIPEFAHVPMILGQDRARLSKRHGATSVTAYRDMGYLPWALVNYLVRLGWAYKDQEVFGKDELIEKFNLEDVGKSACIFNPEKLLWLNQHHIKSLTMPQIFEHLQPLLKEKGYQVEAGDSIFNVIKSLQERSKTLVEMIDLMEFYLKDEITVPPELKDKFLDIETVKYLKELTKELNVIVDFLPATVEKMIKGFAENKEIKLVKIAQPLRVALTGKTVSPPIHEVLNLLGKKKVLERLTKVIG
ncbi:MAG TPA: glutamate--tRNA ligase [bacterium]